ncbi:MAG TPA: tRNA (adenosine(37)-N6)-threonylcarbamoyltransferase complex ATPase subunit type 1 TsaE [Acidimicrobiales bacterium]|nr:tRNA (adenosine(37)-N6)-threonylcarbamoyltransferase complex ATPase subunit type 1 TsaE [Acidimicrobiales bacterium]
MTIRVACPDAAATQALAGRLAPQLEPGDLILLEGDLGAGKTTFTQGLASALGVGEAVTSPTFVLMNIYRTERFDLAHVDVYRLDRLSEVVDLALPEMIDDGTVVVVEWGERAAAALPADYVHIRLEVDDDGAGRTATLDAVGDRWRRRLEAWEAAA